MEDEAPVIYGLEFQARTLCAETAETDSIRFLVGTQSLKLENQVHQIEFDEENNVINKNIFMHREGEIWHMSASPANRNVIATCFSKVKAENATVIESALWKLPNGELDSSVSSEDPTTTAPYLELVCKMNTGEFGQDIRCTVWQPGEGEKIISVVDNHFLLWDIATGCGGARLLAHASLEGKSQPKFTSGQWNPHQNCMQFATTNESCVRGWDLRTMQQVWCIENAHGQLVRDIDFNPNKQYYLATCGDDCYSKFWDIRNPQQSLFRLSDHSHWVWKIRYNHFHDQLVLTSSSDSRVILTSVVSISSEPFGHMVEEDGNGGEELEREKSRRLDDGVIAIYEEHEDSVYGIEWSSADPWTFASLSYDGRLVINRVPRAEKYNILL